MSNYSRSHTHSNKCYTAGNSKGNNSRLQQQPKFPEQNYDPYINDRDCVIHVRDGDTCVEDDVTRVGNDVTRVENDVTRVGDYVIRIGDDVTLFGDNSTRVEEEVTSVEDDVTIVEDYVIRVRDDVTCVGDNVTHVKNDVTRVEDYVTSDGDASDSQSSHGKNERYELTRECKDSHNTFNFVCGHHCSEERGGTLKRQNRCVVPMPAPCMPLCDISGHKFQFSTTIHDGACRVCTCERKPNTLDQSTAVCQTTCTTVTLKSGTGNNLTISVENTMISSLSTSASGMLQLGDRETARPPNQAQRLKTPVRVPTQQSLPESKIEGPTATSSSNELKIIKVGSRIATRPSEGSTTTITTTSTTKAAEAKISGAESTVSVLTSSPTSGISNKRLKTTKKTSTTSVVPAKKGSEAVLVSPTTTMPSQKSATLKVASGIVLISSVKESMTTLTAGSLVSRIPTGESTNKSLSPISNVSSKKSVKTQISSPTRVMSSEKSTKTTIEMDTSPTTTISTQEATIRKAASWTKATISALESRTTPNETTSTTTLATEELATQKFSRPTGPTFTTPKLKLSATPKVSSPTLEVSAPGPYVTTTARTLNPTVATIIPTSTPAVVSSLTTLSKPTTLTALPKSTSFAHTSSELGTKNFGSARAQTSSESGTKNFGSTRAIPTLSPSTMVTSITLPVLTKGKSVVQISAKPGATNYTTTQAIPAVSLSKMVRPNVESITSTVLPKSTSISQTSPKPVTTKPTTNIRPVTDTPEAEAPISRWNIISMPRSIVDQSGCFNTQPIQQTACQGSCNSSAVLNITSLWVDIECLCCKPKNFSIANVSMKCPDGSYKVLKYLAIAECSCETCDSHAYQRRLQIAVGFLHGNTTEITDDNILN
ncbi:Mucin-19 [Stylophora pistillata]|uniref:Mucin-19 n=1 Tax=Stylophora pistillata TaxID=50429 RepID=A0A2B4SIG8_STYPI|nr:Mucin-19 [Stylophora pistillata]